MILGSTNVVCGLGSWTADEVLYHAKIRWRPQGSVPRDGYFSLACPLICPCAGSCPCPIYGPCNNPSLETVTCPALLVRPCAGVCPRRTCAGPMPWNHDATAVARRPLSCHVCTRAFSPHRRPFVPCNRLSNEQIDGLYAALRRVLSQACSCRSTSTELPSEWLFHHRWKGRKEGQIPTPIGKVHHAHISGEL